MKIEKGKAGYIPAQKRRAGLQTAVGFGLVAILLITGYIQTHNRLNLFTVIAILGCLPTCQALVRLITFLPHKTIEKEKAEEIHMNAALLTTAFDLIITSKEKIMPVDAFVISGHTVFGYASSPKTNPIKAAEYIRDTLARNHYAQVTVKIFPDYKAFLSRVEGLNNMVTVDASLADRTQEQAIRNIILTLSM